jgi:aromatic ring-opening dioxygenase catalytic subunit (LigB family)
VGKIVGAFATSHVVFSSAGVEAQARTVIDGFKQIGRKLSSANPDVIVMASSEHGPTLLPLGAQPPFAVGTGAWMETFGEMSIPKVKIPGSPDFAAAFLRGAAEDGFDIASVEDFHVDHGIAIPTILSMPDLSIPIVPLIININSPQVTPSPLRCYNLGKSLRRVVESRPAQEKVAVIGTGGLSLWVGVPEMGRINEEFDRQVLDLLVSGKAEQVARLSGDEILEKAGNGGQEIRNWLFVAGALGEVPGEVLYYEPIPQWMTGMAAMAFRV